MRVSKYQELAPEVFGVKGWASKPVVLELYSSPFLSIIRVWLEPKTLSAMFVCRSAFHTPATGYAEVVHKVLSKKLLFEQSLPGNTWKRLIIKI